jgi:hypothetical protein
VTTNSEYEIREQEGELDEVVARNIAGFHLERMDECQWWMCLRLHDGSEVRVNIGAVNPRAKGWANFFVEEP